MFPDDPTATCWFENTIWGDIRFCGHCGSPNTKEVSDAKPMPYWCPDCRSYFSVRTVTALARSKVPMQKWAIAIYLGLTGLKSVSCMKLHRNINVSQKTALLMLHRIREAWVENNAEPFDGLVEVDETYMGGKRKNMSNAKRSACVDLINLDPSFNSNKTYSAPVGSQAAVAAFKDVWTLDDVDVAWIGIIAERYSALAESSNRLGWFTARGCKPIW